MLVVAPVTIRNYAVSGEFIVITSNGGLNFYLGNNEQAVGVYYNVDGLDLANDPDGRVYAQTVLGTDLRPSEVSGFYMSRAWDFIRDEPGTFLELLGLKALLFMHGKEISQLGYNYQFVAATAVPLLAWLPTFLIVGPLGLAGVYLSLVRWRSMFLVIAMLATELLGVGLFFGWILYLRPGTVPTSGGYGRRDMRILGKDISKWQGVITSVSSRQCGKRA